eukprot:7955294-Pyramimonas_sp.AAC.1
MARTHRREMFLSAVVVSKASADRGVVVCVRLVQLRASAASSNFFTHLAMLVHHVTISNNQCNGMYFMYVHVSSALDCSPPAVRA